MSVGHLPVPGRHLGLAWRPLQLTDEDHVRLLLTRVRAVDQGYHPTALDLSPQWHTATCGDLQSDTLAGIDASGHVRAVAMVRRGTSTVTLAAELEPSWRGRGIGRALLRWQDACAQRLGPAVTEIVVDEARIDRRRLCAAAGFAPAGRVHSLAAPMNEVLERARESGVDTSAITVTMLAPGMWGVTRRGILTARAVRVRGLGSEPDLVSIETVESAVAGPGELVALLRTLRDAYAAGDMSAARMDVDADRTALLDEFAQVGMVVVADAVRYRSEPGVSD
ncbi:GNAT family N-acetyltransferase [Ruania alkalisoli]|uniref:GNAT family N-acetyltransferase n=1 Tax=Ruania alkalisoli TaxID=2779775 RepID=A0A7M1SRB2_9MICO|nr:GNAT family N-acetyltransferase [Ruania alkalisoli]QOR69123.1 GNAT family N-acetyltransferase [Ruania alkalisoli]